jgi:succinate-semialdehyde dehydrogenase/glutarate-semialdehyde dehydrogenase
MYEGLAYGMVCVNDWLPATPEAPFVGVKQSGIGAESGPEGLHDYLETKVVYLGGIP